MLKDEDEKGPKKRCPVDDANILSRCVFWYSLKLFREGNKRELDETDLTQVLDYHRSDKLGEKISRVWMKEYDKALSVKRSPNMFKVIFITFWRELLKYGLVLFAMEIFIRLTQPLFIGLFIRYFMQGNANNTLPLQRPMYLERLPYYWSPHQSAIQHSEAYVFGGGILLTSLISVMTIHPYFLAVLEIGLRIRVACCSLLYRKALRIKLTELAGKTVGNVMNLMSNDVNRFDVAVVYLHYLWIAPLQSLLVVVCLYQELGKAAIYGFFVIIGVSIFQVFLALRTANLRTRSGERTDDRVMQMNEIIQSMEVIKMYAWEYAFVKLINRLRKRELAMLLQTSWIRGLIMSFIMFTTRLAIFVTVLTYIMEDEKITAQKVFVVISYYQILRMTMTVYFSQGVCMLAETIISIKRIKVFMLLEETKIGNPAPLDANWRQKMNKYSIVQRTSNFSVQTEPKVKLVRCLAKYGTEVCLRDINFEASMGELLAIVGPVGAGKSVLLKVILGELHLFSGKRIANGSISFASQEPWLFAGSIRQNILFGQEMDVARYKDVCSVCELLSDFRNLQFGERTIIGEQGISLSGGQRARVNLARAVYKQADIYLLDDPLSAVDITVGQRLFEKCIKSYLGDKIVILVTHQLQYLRRADQIIVLNKGVIVAKGDYTEVLGQKGSFVDLLVDKPTTVVTDEKDAAASTGRLLRGMSVTSAMFASMIDIEGKKRTPVVLPEMRTYGAVGFSNYREYFIAGARNCCGIFMMVLLFLAAQFCASGGDYFLSKWVFLEEVRYSKSENVTSVSAGVWDRFTRKQCISIFGALIIGTIIIAIIRSLTFFAVCMRASFRLHNLMFTSVIKACLQFFRVNPSGRILNRFSKDLGTVDELLPNSFIDTTQLLLNLVGALLVVTLVEVYLLIPVAVMIISFYFLRKMYLSTSRNVKRLEGIAKSPVFAHLNASLQGLPTIRSMEVEVILVKEFDHLQDIHSSAWYMFLYCSRAFGLWLDLICTAFIGLVTFGFLILDNDYDGSSVGLAITQCIGLSGLIQWGMRQSAELENNMTSVERVLEFARIEQEANLESKPHQVPPVSWPGEGKIEFIEVSMRYYHSEPYVLKNLNLIINPGEKIGIVGRTGAGKSSLLKALFRLSEFEGEVFVDDIDISVLGLHDLRRKISIIPQEPILFSGTLRHNLDPFKEYSDEAVFNALLDVELQAAVTNGIKCLDDEMTERGSNLSLGQRQMVCLARAILRNNTILVMDEATANVDMQTDKFIQHTIRTKFAHCTVLTIAHRLITVMDSDRVVVMDAGMCIEYDYPHLLLQNNKSVFYDMVMKTGVNVSNQLKLIALEHYQEKFGKDDGPSSDPQPD